MKTQLLFLGFFIMTNFFTVNAQHVSPGGILFYPIPSYNIAVLGNADFEEGYSDIMPSQTEGKRILNVQTYMISNGASGCDITVWVFTLDRQTILGPYTLGCDDLLSVEIDSNLWGCLVQAGKEVTVAVYIGDGSSASQKKAITKHRASF